MEENVHDLHLITSHLLSQLISGLPHGLIKKNKKKYVRGEVRGNTRQKGANKATDASALLPRTIYTPGFGVVTPQVSPVPHKTYDHPPYIHSREVRFEGHRGIETIFGWTTQRNTTTFSHNHIHSHIHTSDTQ